jgi:hypothetical protein
MFFYWKTVGEDSDSNVLLIKRVFSRKGKYTWRGKAQKET